MPGSVCALAAEHQHDRHIGSLIRSGELMQVKAKWKMIPIEDGLADAPDSGVHEVRGCAPTSIDRA